MALPNLRLMPTQKTGRIDQLVGSIQQLETEAQHYEQKLVVNRLLIGKELGELFDEVQDEERWISYYLPLLGYTKVTSGKYRRTWRRFIDAGGNIKSLQRDDVQVCLNAIYALTAPDVPPTAFARAMGVIEETGQLTQKQAQAIVGEERLQQRRQEVLEAIYLIPDPLQKQALTLLDERHPLFNADVIPMLGHMVLSHSVEFEDILRTGMVGLPDGTQVPVDQADTTTISAAVGVLLWEDKMGKSDSGWRSRTEQGWVKVERIRTENFIVARDAMTVILDKIDNDTDVVEIEIIVNIRRERG